MKIAILKELAEGETRVSAAPETVRRLTKAGRAVAVLAGAGERAGFDDESYRLAGADVLAEAAQVLAGADVLLAVGRPIEQAVSALPRGAVLVGMLGPAGEREYFDRLAEAGVSAFALERVPRTTRAQMMDVLSSQSTVAGYKAVLLGANALPQMMPMMMTAAGTVQPARVLVIGAGVAGLQAIATARRLGGVVWAVDTRPAVGEQVKSLGARFVPLEVQHTEAEQAGGYAADLGEAFYRQEQRTLAPRVSEADLVICTALIPGRPAPALITEEMVRSMQPGSVIVDLSAGSGGNCTLTEPGSTVVRHGVTIIGLLNLAGMVPHDASQMYSRNLEAFIGELTRDGQIVIDLENEILRQTLVVHEGEVRL